MGTVLVENEVAYDLLQDNLELILRLIENPLPRDAVVGFAGSERTVERLERYGLIRATPGGVRAVSSTYQQMRQEGMVSFLERYVLPSLTASAQPTTRLMNDTLLLAPEERDGMLAGPVQSFFEDLSSLADAPLQDPGARLSVLVIGASEVRRDELDPADQALLHLQTASRLRSSRETRNEAVVSQFDCIADRRRFETLTNRTNRFMDELSTKSCPPERATYQLMVASHWRIPGLESHEGALQ